MDFTIKILNSIWAVEVKSGKMEEGTELSSFCRQNPKEWKRVVGSTPSPLAGEGIEVLFRDG